MTDYLHTNLSAQELLETSALALAHVGDAVYELLVRTYLCKSGGRSARTLHRRTVAMVSANAQAQAAERLAAVLDEEERGVFLRGRNTKVHTVPRGAELAAYHTATGLECLFGYLHLSGKYERMNELFNWIVQADQNRG